MSRLTSGDRMFAARTLISQLTPPSLQLVTRRLLANLREQAEHAPAFAMPFRLTLRVLEEVLQDDGETDIAQHARAMEFRRRLEDGELDAIAIVDRCLELEVESCAPTLRLHARPLASVLAIAMTIGIAIGCAHTQKTAHCREQCADLRGPVWTVFGGPTLPPDAFTDCVDRCQGT